ncbi:MAG TPA: histidine kinase [Solirubrobacteraceae bacterium]
MKRFREFLVEDRWLRGRPRGSGRPAVALIWLGFVLFPVVVAISEGGLSPGGHALVIAAAVAFVIAYGWLVVSWNRPQDGRLLPVLFAVMVCLTVALTLTDRGDWVFLFTYCSACAALAAPSSLAFGAVIMCAVLAVVTGAMAGASWGNGIGYGASAVGVGLLLVLMRDLRTRNQELTEARAELARNAVARERERFARDLHDLLGHTLSVIAIKAELAGRLLPDRPDDAAREVGDVEQVARNALSEVRDAVSGYRQPTLDRELAGARMALSAAGIEAEVELAQVRFDPQVEAVLAWAVREGATNVIRHSGASHCTVTVTSRLGGAEVEVADDGDGGGAGDGSGVSAGGMNGSGVNGHGGHGLAGLRERATGLGGWVEAGARPAGGFRLAVSVPVDGQAGGDPSGSGAGGSDAWASGSCGPDVPGSDVPGSDTPGGGR